MGNRNFAPREDYFEYASSPELEILYQTTSKKLALHGDFKKGSAEIIETYDDYWPVYDRAEVPLYVVHVPKEKVRLEAPLSGMDSGVTFFFQPLSYFRAPEYEYTLHHAPPRCSYVWLSNETRSQWLFLSTLMDLDGQATWASCRALVDRSSGMILEGNTDIRMTQLGEGLSPMTRQECVDLQRLAACIE